MPRPKATLSAVRAALKKHANPGKAVKLQRYFKTNPGEYAEHEVFLGLSVPEQRSVAKTFKALQLSEVEQLLHSPIHEERLTALFILLSQFHQYRDRQEQIISIYLENLDYVNTWDLIDTSAEMLGEYFFKKKQTAPIEKLLHSPFPWHRRIAMVSTYYVIKKGHPQFALQFAEVLLQDKDSMVQKAVGWMLKEVAKKVEAKYLYQFLNQHITQMPQVMYSSATERLPISKKEYYKNLRRKYRASKKFRTKVLAKDKLEFGIATAVQLLKQDAVVAFPTETVYGLGARIFSPTAIAKIFEVKGRPSDNPLIAHVSNTQQIAQIAEDLPADFEKLAKAFWPGPLTMVVKKKDGVPSVASASLPTIGIRMPSHPIALNIIEQLGEPIVAPSANLSGKPSTTTAQHVLDDLQGKIPLILDGGPSTVGIESTIIDLTTAQPTILRSGAITQEELTNVLGKKVLHAVHAKGEQPKAPGMKYRHYAPQATITIIENFTPEVIGQLRAHTGSAVILTNQKLDMTQLPKTITQHSFTTATLYAQFRQADQEHRTHIFIMLDTDQQKHVGLKDRIQRAAQG